MEKEVITRKDLYELVWKEPLSKLSKKYALSDNGFRKLCIRLNIPIPKNGYWQKLKFNKPVKIEKLPTDFLGEDKIELLPREEGSEINLDQSPVTILTKQILNDSKVPLKVSESLTNPDNLIKLTKEYWEKSKKDRYYRDDKAVCLSIHVENINKKRALLFMDAFIKLLKYRGHTFIFENHSVKIVIDDIKILFHLREATKRIPTTGKYGTSEYIPTGELVLKTGEHSRVKEWRDGKIKIEEQLAKILANLEIDAQKEKEWREEIRIYWLKHEEENRRKEEIKKRKDEEIAQFKKLVDLSEQYNKSLLIRQYVEAEKQKAIRTNGLTQEIKEWINWANDKADWYDPTINKPDEILDT